MKTKEKQCEMCCFCHNFFAIDQLHLHRYDATPTLRMCLTEQELRKQGWKISSSKVWSKK